MINKEIHRTITIRKVIDFIAYPHRENILRLIVSNILYLLLGRIINPYIIRHSTFIIFPGTELTHHPVISQPFAVGRITTETTFGQRNHLRQSAFLIDGIQLSGESVTNPVTIDNLFTVGRPRHHHIIRSHTVTQIITTIRSRIRYPQRLSSIDGNCKHFGISIILTGKGNCLSIRWKTRKHLIPDMRSQSLGLASAHRHLIQIAGIRKNNLLPIRSRKTQQSGFICQGSQRKSRKSN